MACGLPLRPICATRPTTTTRTMMKLAADRAKMEGLRREADRTRLDASEQVANAATADGQARRAQVWAQKLQLEADARAKDVSEARMRHDGTRPAADPQP